MAISQNQATKLGELYQKLNVIRSVFDRMNDKPSKINLTVALVSRDRPTDGGVWAVSYQDNYIPDGQPRHNIRNISGHQLEMDEVDSVLPEEAKLKIKHLMMVNLADAGEKVREEISNLGGEPGEKFEVNDEKLPAEYIAVVGGLSDGFMAYGPWTTYKDAADWACEKKKNNNEETFFVLPVNGTEE